MTYRSHDFHEIMPTIFRRFVEKEARDWRQIYKALQLLEYLVKNGAEKVVDEARAHLATIKILRNFHYIDDQGKDQGINSTSDYLIQFATAPRSLLRCSPMSI